MLRGGKPMTRKDYVDIASAIGDTLGQLRYLQDIHIRRERETAVWRTAEVIADYLAVNQRFSREEFKDNILRSAKVGHANQQLVTHNEFLKSALGLPVE
jgi:Ser/Thr protein kinase RdoA (MazF antagonist)